jgi:Flp pilus assembly protein TadD
LTPENSPHRHTVSRAAVAYALIVVLFLASGTKPDPRFWGLHSLAFLTPGHWLVASLALAALFFSPVARRVGVTIAHLGTRWVGSRLAPLGVAAASLVFFHFNRIEFHFLGDGIAWSNGLSAGSFFYYFEPLAIAATRAVALAVDPNDLTRSAGTLSVFLGPLYVYATARLCRTLWTQPQARGTAWALLLFHPAVLLFCGYLESYPLLLVVQVLYAWALVESVRRHCPIVVPVLIAAVAIATHVSAVAWLPALMTVTLLRAPRSAHPGAGNRGALGWSAGNIVRTLVVPATAVVIAACLVWLVGVEPRRLLAAIVGSTGLGGHSWSWMFSARHVVDVLNEIGLLLAPALVLLAAGATRLRSASPEWRAILAMLAGPLVIAMAIEPRIGGARDWDLFVPVMLPAILVCVEAWRRVPLPAGVATSGRAVGLAAVMTLAWLAVGLSQELSAGRLEVLQRASGLFSNYARGYANETLGIYYRDRDVVAARDAWQRATEANPNNSRYFNNLGNDEARLGNNEAMCAAFRRALELGLDEYFVIFNAASCARMQEQFEVADSLLTRLVRREPARYEAWSDRGFVRLRLGRPRDAMTDLREAATRAPRDPETSYRIGLAHMQLGRLDQARAAWERTLQLEPQHPRALRRLQGLESP